MTKFKLITSAVFMLTIFANCNTFAQQTLENDVLTNKASAEQSLADKKNKNPMVDPANNTADNIAAEKDIEDKEESNLDRHHDSKS